MIIALNKAPHESLFSTELVIILVEHFFSRYYRTVIYRCLIPFVIYFLLVLFYLSYFAVEGIEGLNDVEKNLEYAMRILILIFVSYFLFFEIVCILRDGLSYLKDIFNWIDIISFMLNIYLIIATVYIESLTENRIVNRAISALGVVLMWFKAFYWLRIFTGTSFYVRLIRDTLYDIRYFLILFILILATFGNALLILNENRPE